jgi:filamin
VQKKSFTRWCNELLRKRQLEINDICEDFKTGVLLIQLLEILTSKSIKHNRTPKMEVQKLENLSLAFQIMQGQCAITLINIGPRDLLEGNMKLILALIWALILHFKIKIGNSENDSNDELLRWVNSQIPAYAVKNFTSDWQNGKSICALAEALLPGQMKLPNDFTNDHIKDCTMGINNALKNMKIPIILDPEDMVSHPDKQAMMTYLSYFREYYMNKDNIDKQKELELIPDISKCIVYGQGIEAGNEAGKSTYFTIEIRNAFDRKVPRGGHNLFNRITGPHTQQNFQATDHNDGTYYVTYTPDEGGNYVVEVRLENKPLQSSPYHVTILDIPEEIITEPLPCWYVLAETKPEKWHPYDNPTNETLEKQFNTFGGGVVNILNNGFKVDLSLKEETNLQKKGFFSEKRTIRRGTWFWVDNQGTPVPYSEELAVILEKAFKEGKFVNRTQIDITDKKLGKKRWVTETAPGVYTQYRDSKNRNPDGRPVLRGFQGHLIEKSISKKK